MIDFGSCAPAAVFQQIFQRQGVEITARQAREPMGMAKRDHILTITQMEDVNERWIQKFGQPANDNDVDRMYQEFLPLQKEVLADHCDLIPGAAETFAWCREQGLRVGSSTGYTRELMEVVKPIAKVAGYEPEIVLCAEDAPQGRPAPWLIFECAKQWGIYPMKRIVKVDDTVVGIQAGINAGCWTVGVAISGNLAGMSLEEWNALDESDQAVVRKNAREDLLTAGAHLVIDSVAEMPSVVAELNQQPNYA